MQENTRGGSAVLVYLAALETEAERDRFQALYERYRGLMFHRAMLLLRNESDAEDAVHQAFLAILEHFEKISSIDCPKTRAYVVIIAESKADEKRDRARKLDQAVDQLRARKRLASEAELEALPGPEIPLPGGSDLARAMAALPARYRQALLLRFQMGYTTRELAGLFGMTEASAGKLLWRAKQALKGKLEEVSADGT